MKVAGRGVVLGEMNPWMTPITKMGAILEEQGLNPDESVPRDTITCGS